MWFQILLETHNDHFQEVIENPKFFITAKCSKELGTHLKQIHNNRPIVALGLNSLEDVEDMASICLSLMDGSCCSVHEGEMLHANLLVCDNANVLDTAAHTHCPHASWLNRLVCLVDGDIGPQPVENSDLEIEPVACEFDRALIHAIGKRLNHLRAHVTSYKMDMDSCQMSWVQFLTSMENRLPGISSIARNLLVTLAFGLVEMYQRIKKGKTDIQPGQILAFAKWIIYRMANARAVMAGDIKREKSLIHAKRILETLEVRGSLTTREIYRSRTLDASTGKELLLGMERAGLLRREGDRWECLAGGDISKLEIDPILIEV